MDPQALVGKKMLNVISYGGSQEAYQTDGTSRYSINQFLAPFDQTAVLCRMTYLPPFVPSRSTICRPVGPIATPASK